MGFDKNPGYQNKGDNVDEKKVIRQIKDKGFAKQLMIEDQCRKRSAERIRKYGRSFGIT